MCDDVIGLPSRALDLAATDMTLTRSLGEDLFSFGGSQCGPGELNADAFPETALASKVGKKWSKVRWRFSFGSPKAGMTAEQPASWHHSVQKGAGGAVTTIVLLICRPFDE
jgi:hypothetical protein